ncbi:MAG: PH domain-containing protein [Oscillospiraceae bacterium]|nr:PH domain-containing protein [Oscillospiraceae bacterium]
MIDFSNDIFVKMTPVNPKIFGNEVLPFLVSGEEIIGTYQALRDGVVFTNKRIIAINAQGISGKKKDMTSLPYRNIQVFSVENAGSFDLDSELELWFSGLGKVKFEFAGDVDITQICKLISDHVL